MGGKYRVRSHSAYVPSHSMATYRIGTLEVKYQIGPGTELEHRQYRAGQVPSMVYPG